MVKETFVYPPDGDAKIEEINGRNFDYIDKNNGFSVMVLRGGESTTISTRANLFDFDGVLGVTESVCYTTPFGFYGPLIREILTAIDPEKYGEFTSFRQEDEDAWVNWWIWKGDTKSEQEWQLQKPNGPQNITKWYDFWQNNFSTCNGKGTAGDCLLIVRSIRDKLGIDIENYFDENHFPGISQFQTDENDTPEKIAAAYVLTRMEKIQVRESARYSTLDRIKPGMGAERYLQTNHRNHIPGIICSASIPQVIANMTDVALHTGHLVGDIVGGKNKKSPDGVYRPQAYAEGRERFNQLYGHVQGKQYRQEDFTVTEDSMSGVMAALGDGVGTLVVLRPDDHEEFLSQIQTEVAKVIQNDPAFFNKDLHTQVIITPSLNLVQSQLTPSGQKPGIRSIERWGARNTNSVVGMLLLTGK